MQPILKYRRRSVWRRFWQHNFVARSLLLALSSGSGAFMVGAFMGVNTWISSGHSESLSYWVIGDSFFVGIEMTLFGQVVGFLVFSAIGLASSRWSVRRRWRFAQGMKRRFFVPLMASFAATSLGAAALWFAWQGGFTPQMDLDDVLRFTGKATIVFGSCLFAVLLARFSKTKSLRRKTPVQTERLLPLS